jgi:hypothetical protein
MSTDSVRLVVICNDLKGGMQYPCYFRDSEFVFQVHCLTIGAPSNAIPSESGEGAHRREAMTPLLEG